MKMNELKSGLLVPAAKPEDPNVERRRRFNEYYEQHKLCPKCGSGNISMTTVGYSVADGATDGNRSWCGNCRWIGVGHDLIAEGELSLRAMRDEFLEYSRAVPEVEYKVSQPDFARWWSTLARYLK